MFPLTDPRNDNISYLFGMFFRSKSLTKVRKRNKKSSKAVGVLSSDGFFADKTQTKYAKTFAFFFICPKTKNKFTICITLFFFRNIVDRYYTNSL